MMLVRLDLNPIVSLFQHKCEVSETVSTTTLHQGQNRIPVDFFKHRPCNVIVIISSHGMLDPFASEAVYTRNFFSDRLSDSV